MRGAVAENEPLARHTTIRVGGPARVFALPESEDDVVTALRWAEARGLSWRVIGLGSNLLCPDEGFDGLILDLGRACGGVRFEGTRATVGAGVHLAPLIQAAAARGLSGLEGVAGVPGTVGGALAMNAGTSAGETGAVVERVRVVSPDGRIRELTAVEMAFAYRHSRLQDEPLVALGAVLRLTPSDPARVKQDLSERAVRRRQTQPLELPNAGSIWRNPPGDYAGRLVEAAGCRGFQCGQAQVSPRHGNFIVNLGQARARDVLAVMAEVRRRVAGHLGVVLHPEVRWLAGQTELLSLLDRGPPPGDGG
jgi:UDP-N-acetylmuramate dehydrogenase